MYNQLKAFLVVAWWLVVTGVSAQQLSLAGTQKSFAPGESVTLNYAGAAAGDKILLFHNLSIMPLVEMGVATGETGSYQVPAVLQPGKYLASLTAQDGQPKADVEFWIKDYPADEGVKIVVIADPHVMGPDLVQDPTNERYLYLMGIDRKLLPESYDIFLTCLDSIRAIKPAVVIIPGDLTKDGELISHQAVAVCLQQLADEGIPSLVIPGNHDMENSGARIYTSSGTKVTETITPSDFENIYFNFGFSTATSFDDVSLSYVCEPIPGLSFIGIDDCRIPSRGDTNVGDGEYGRLYDSTIQWILNQADMAKQRGNVVVAAIHHQMMQHYNGQQAFMASAATENGDSLARVFADHGIHLVLTGHMHIPNASRIVGFETDKVLTEVSSASPVAYPSQFRVITLSNDLSHAKIDTKYIHRSANVDSIQYLAHHKIETSLGRSISKLVPRYMNTINQMLNEFSGIPGFENIIEDVPTDPDTLAAVATKAFGETMKMVIYTSSEGNENLKNAADRVLQQLSADCTTACDLIFDQQNAATRSFLATSLYIYMLDYVEDVIKSMLSDTSHMGEDIADRTDDLYLSVNLRDAQSGIAVVRHDDENKGCRVYGANGMALGKDVNQLPKGFYIVRKGDKTTKVVIR